MLKSSEAALADRALRYPVASAFAPRTLLSDSRRNSTLITFSRHKGLYQGKLGSTMKLLHTAMAMFMVSTSLGCKFIGSRDGTKTCIYIDYEDLQCEYIAHVHHFPARH